MEETNAAPVSRNRVGRDLVLLPRTVWKPLGRGSAPSTSALACVADGGNWHEFVSASPADRDGRFRVVLFRFSETGPSAIGFVAWLHSAEDGQDRRHRDLRQELSGSEKLFEVCQGAMDYWACPVGTAADRLRRRHQNPHPEGLSCSLDASPAFAGEDEINPPAGCWRPWRAARLPPCRL